MFELWQQLMNTEVPLPAVMAMAVVAFIVGWFAPAFYEVTNMRRTKDE